MWMRTEDTQSSAGQFDGVELPSLYSILSRGLVRLQNWLSVPVRCNARILVLVAESGAALFSFILNVSMFDAVSGRAWITTGAWTLIPFVIVLRAGGLLAFGVWRRSFRYASIADLGAIVKAVTTSSFLIYGVYLIARVQADVSLPARLILADGTTTFVLLCLIHFSVQIYMYGAGHAKTRSVDAKRVIIVGAGDAAASVLRDLLSTQEAAVCPVGLVDDSPTKEGMCIHGVPVVGRIASLSDAVLSYRAAEVFVCIPSASAEQMHRILSACLECGVPIRTLPSVSQLINGRASWQELRSINIEDLLRRKQSVPDHSLTRNLVHGRTVLVTGAGGSIGSELSRQIAQASPRRLILLDKSENNLFYIHTSLAEAFPNLALQPVLSDILDRSFIHTLFRQERPDLVFHAAAFKHVGMMEIHPGQAIRNNVLGTRNVLESAVEAGVHSLVNISTDKAVNPHNYMGISKKLAELLVCGFAQRYAAPFKNVRFGNVAGSSGSVLQIFSDRITNGKPLRITDPRATRYFMTIPEAVFLVLCAAKLGHGGETFILEMGDPVNIYELARTISLFNGIVPGEDLPLQFTGLREGEKIHEELTESWEIRRPTLHPQIFELKTETPLRLDIFAIAKQLDQFISDHDVQAMLEYIEDTIPGRKAKRESHLAAFSPHTGSGANRLTL